MKKFSYIVIRSVALIDQWIFEKIPLMNKASMLLMICTWINLPLHRKVEYCFIVVKKFVRGFIVDVKKISWLLSLIV